MRTNSLPIFILSLLLQLFLTKSDDSLATALYVFGDSLSDSGNNNMLQTQAKANYVPYGIDFARGVTGRFTNGKTFPDFLAGLLGLPADVPPYMGMSPSQRRQTLTGVTYASGSAGILSETGSALGQRLPLDKQIDLFKSTVDDDLDSHFVGSRALNEYMSKAIFMVSIGSNDYLNNYLQPEFYDSSRRYTSEEFAQLLIRKLSLSLRRLYILGARKMLVFEIAAIGCIPAVAYMVAPSGSCVEQVNQLVSFYNVRLPGLLQQLQSDLPGSIIIRGMTFNIGIDAKQNPSGYGLTNAETPCCTVNSASNPQCIPNGATCPNRNQYFYYDNAHPTEVVNYFVATGCFNRGTSICSPLNVQQLAQAL